MKLSYNPENHRRCLACPNSGQPPLVAVTSWVGPRQAAMLECGHLDWSMSDFIEGHPEWEWDLSPEFVADVAAQIEDIEAMYRPQEPGPKTTRSLCGTDGGVADMGRAHLICMLPLSHDHDHFCLHDGVAYQWPQPSAEEHYPWEFTISDLRASGLLWLINTTVFHPRGMAIGVSEERNRWTVYAAGHDKPFDYLTTETDPECGVDIDDAYRRANRFIAVAKFGTPDDLSRNMQRFRESMAAKDAERE